jgi:hypothetical protein
LLVVHFQIQGEITENLENTHVRYITNVSLNSLAGRTFFESEIWPEIHFAAKLESPGSSSNFLKNRSGALKKGKVLGLCRRFNSAKNHSLAAGLFDLLNCRLGELVCLDSKSRR